MAKTCLECGDSIVGRVDKKFCGDHCRSAYNNRLNSDQSNLVRGVNRILRRNRRILESFNPREKTTVKKEELLFEGFRFRYFTNEHVTRSGKVYRFCYDHGYLDLDDNRVALIRKKDSAE